MVQKWKSTNSTDLNLNLDEAIIASFDCQNKYALVSSRGTDANEKISRGLVAKEICSLGFIHVTCEPTGNKIKKQTFYLQRRNNFKSDLKRH